MPRLDSYLTEKEIYKSRERAKRAIEAGLVSVDGKVITKPAYEVDGTEDIKASEDPVPFVSRGALKLEGAFELADIDVQGKVCIDVGASTGGFTEVLLKRGAAKVYAVDVGHGQLAPKLASDSRVMNLEGTDIRSNALKEFAGSFDFAAVDVSFISLKLILKSVYDLLKENAYAAFLIKPQFEAGRKSLNKKGIVKNEKLVLEAVAETEEAIRLNGFEIQAKGQSPITGGDGNREFLVVAKKCINDV